MQRRAVELSAMSEADLDAVCAIFSEVTEEGTSYVQDEAMPRDAVAEYWLARGGEQWVARDADGRVVGAYTLRPNHVGRGSHVATASYLVARAARGEGLGKRLGAHSIERARAVGFRAIQFNLVVSTNAPAVAAWRALGFEIVATLSEAFRDRERGFVDAYVMYLKLVP